MAGMGVESAVDKAVSNGVVRFDRKRFDFDTQAGFAVSIVDPTTDRTLFRHAVMTSICKTIEAPVYGPNEKVYVTAVEAAALLEEDDAPALLADDGGFYYERRVVVSPGKYEKRSEAELFAIEQEARGRLIKYVGDRLAEMRRIVELIPKEWPG